MPRPAAEALIGGALVIRPPRPRASIAPPTSFVPRKALVRLRSRSRRQVSSGMASVGMFSRRPPTLLTRMSIPRGSASASPQARSHSAGSPMSAWTVATSRPRARISSAARSRLAASRPVSTRSAPASANPCAIARPRPPLPPVTSARLPSRRKRSSTLMPLPSRCPGWRSRAFPASRPALSSSGDGRARPGMTLAVEGVNSSMDGEIELDGVAEGAVGQVVALQVAPGALDVVQLRRVLREPLDREPGARGERLPARLARMDRAVVQDQGDRPILAARRRAVVPVEPRQQGDEVAGPLGGAGEDDQLAAGVVEHAEERALLRLPWRLDPEVGAAPGPAVGEIGVGQRLRLVPEQQVDVASPRLLPQEPEAQARVVDRPRVLPALERVPRPAPAVAPFRSTALSSTLAILG